MKYSARREFRYGVYNITKGNDETEFHGINYKGREDDIWVFDTEAERDAKYDELVANQVIIDKAREGEAALEVSALIATLASYATEFKNGKVVQILTVLNQVGRAIFDKVENETTVNQDYEVLLHSMLIEMYANHRELYTALFAEETIEEVYETKVVVDFFKVIFANKYITI